MQIRAELGKHRGFPLLYLSGELDMAAEDVLREYLGELAKSDLCAILHVNEVTYSDASAVSMLLDAKQYFDSRGGTMAFVCCDAEVLRVLLTLGLLSSVDVFDDVDEAAEFLERKCPTQPVDRTAS